MIDALRLLASGDPETWFIVWTSVQFSMQSTLFAAVPAVAVGTALAISRGRIAKAIAAVLNALTSVPTVVIGLLVYSMISRSGPLGFFDALYQPAGVIAGQALLAFPVTCAIVYAGFAKLDARYIETVRTLGARGISLLFASVREGKFILASAVVTAFGRVTGEVGVSMMLGGNIRWVTRTMTTAIALDTAKGDFDRALSLGIVILALALVVNAIAHWMVRHER
jgi:tungstate transport system permease protein